LLKVWNDQGRNLLHLACSAEGKKAKTPEASAAQSRRDFTRRGGGKTSPRDEAYDRPMDEELVTVRNCNWLHEAEFVKSVLDADGIDAQIPDEYIAGVQPCYGAAIGGVRVQVRSADLERAQQSLAATIPVE